MNQARYRGIKFFSRPNNISVRVNELKKNRRRREEINIRRNNLNKNKNRENN